MRPLPRKVFGTIAASMTFWNGLRGSLAKYSAASRTSISVASIAMPFMRLPVGSFRAPLLKSIICWTM